MNDTKKAKRSTMRENTIRTRDGGTKAIRYGRRQAIALMCTECLGWEGDPKECTSPMCPLYPFRSRTMASQRAEEEETK